MSYKIVDYNSKYNEDISNIVIRNLIEINSKDYGLEKMREHCLMFTPEEIAKKSKTGRIYAALDGEKPVGTLRVEKNMHGGEHDYAFLTIFVLPEYHKKGIGRMLIENAEKYVRELRGETIIIPSSVFAHGFYNKLGYDYVNGKEPDESGNIMMKKIIAK